MIEPEEKNQEIAKSYEEQVNTDGTSSPGARIYERPTRSPVLTFMIVLLILAIVAAVLFFQFIR